MAVTLTVNGITFTFLDQEISSVRSNITSRAETIEISATGPMGSLNFDYDGSTKSITVKGQLVTAATTRTSSGTVTSILSQKQWLESLINGSQTTITFSSEYEAQSVTGATGASSPNQGAFTSTECMVQSLTFEEQEANPGELPFTMTLQVGNV